jgi:hypothetical protein
MTVLGDHDVVVPAVHSLFYRYSYSHVPRNTTASVDYDNKGRVSWKLSSVGTEVFLFADESIAENGLQFEEFFKSGLTPLSAIA